MSNDPLPPTITERPRSPEPAKAGYARRITTSSPLTKAHRVRTSSLTPPPACPTLSASRLGAPSSTLASFLPLDAWALPLRPFRRRASASAACAASRSVSKMPRCRSVSPTVTDARHRPPAVLETRPAAPPPELEDCWRGKHTMASVERGDHPPAYNGI
jgi:hypothetical protein